MSIPDSSTLAIHTQGPLTLQDTTAFLESIHISPIKTDNTKETGAKIDEIVKLRFIQPDNTLQDVCVSKTQLRVVLQSSELRKEALASNTAIVEFFENKLKEFQKANAGSAFVLPPFVNDHDVTIKKIPEEELVVPELWEDWNVLKFTPNFSAEMTTNFSSAKGNAYKILQDTYAESEFMTASLFQQLAEKTSPQEHEYGNRLLLNLIEKKNFPMLYRILTVIKASPKLKDLYRETLERTTKTPTNLFMPCEYVRQSEYFMCLCEIMEILSDDKTLSIKEASKYFLSDLFPNIILYCPEKALVLLQKYVKNLAKIPIANLLFAFKKYAGLALEPSQEKHFAACIDFLMHHKAILPELIPHSKKTQNTIKKNVEETLLAFVQMDFSIAFDAVFRMFNTLVPLNIDTFSAILQWDSLKCLKQLFAHWIRTKTINHPSLAHTMLLNIEMHNSPRCISYIFKCVKFDPSVKHHLIGHFALRGYTSAVLALCRNSIETATNYFFEHVIYLLENSVKDEDLIKKMMQEPIKKMLRVSPFEEVDKLIFAFIRRYPHREEFLFACYEDIKAEVLKVLPVITRTTQPQLLNLIQKTYTKNVPSKYNFVEEDLKFGALRRQEVEKLIKLLESTSTTPTGQFNDLDSSSNSTRRAAYFLEQLSALNQNKGARDHKAFTLRKAQSVTPIEVVALSRYGWSIPLIAVMLRCSKAYDISKEVNVTLYYRNNVVSMLKNPFGAEDHNTPILVFHGMNNLQRMWHFVEDTFESLMAFNLKPPTNKTMEAQENYELRLTKFYESVAELVWLVGNIQPFERGSGTAAEFLFAIVHLKHGLEPPVLKVQFPQLDVLDIIFPLSDYQKLFTYFFEPSTLPEHLRRPDLPGSVLEQMEALYKEING